MIIPAAPFQATSKSGKSIYYVTQAIGGYTLSWNGPEVKGGSMFGAGETFYKTADLEEVLTSGDLVIVEPAPVDLRTALKIKLFEMRIATMEASLAALKQEFELHKQDVKGTH